MEKRSLAESRLEGRFSPVEEALGARTGAVGFGDGGFTGRASGLRRLVAYRRLPRASHSRKAGAARSDVDITTRGAKVLRQALHNSHLAGALV